MFTVGDPTKRANAGCVRSFLRMTIKNADFSLGFKIITRSLRFSGHSEQMHKHLRGIPDGRKGLILTIVETMYQTGRDLGRGYRETSENGLAKLYREGDGACD